MQSVIPVIDHNQFQLLGKILFRQNPELAHQLMSAYNTGIPHETDFSLIRVYFHTFCGRNGFEPQDYTGGIYNAAKTETRKVFIAAILHLYCPEVYTQPLKCLNIPRGLSKTIADTLDLLQPLVSRMLREIITRHDIYDDFRERVETVVAQLKAREVA